MDQTGILKSVPYDDSIFENQSFREDFFKEYKLTALIQ